ncbi:iron-sulfur cluster repair di-iron protein [Janibacter cremeus]|uniref:Regulator of cell morphogenesis and NO signaling n=1 Tax=Janibacter cremeus TaxID=1285192 RepID=A0A852VQF1_9MICO|nr:iron-sulfur cluster repair di-iron protein [Janibacter cremeus]NYF98139.1 regulator of cell morphogenesis and NO signaling [Janibacter cremeus]
MAVATTATLGDLVAEDPRRSRVLEQLGLDYCCHGQRPLEEAARTAGLDVMDVSTRLDLPGERPAVIARDLEMAALAHDIVDTHHAYTWEEMPRLQALVDKVAGVHGDRHPELAEVKATYERIIAELEPHMTREERVIFPAISRLEKTQAPVRLSSGDFSDALRELIAEHDVVGDLLTRIRGLTGGHTPPEDACNSYRAMLTGLAELERDVHEHVHKENNLLFPRVLEMQERLSGA